MLRPIFRLLPAALLVTTLACNNGDYSADPQGTLPISQAMIIKATDCASAGKRPVSCFVDDQEFVGDSTTGRASLDSVGGLLVFSLAAQNNAYKIRIRLGNYTGTKQYPFYNGAPDPLAVIFSDTAHAYSNLYAGEGVLNITRDDDTLEGTFYFKVGDSNKVERGIRSVCGGYFRNVRR